MIKLGVRTREWRGPNWDHTVFHQVYSSFLLQASISFILTSTKLRKKGGASKQKKCALRPTWNESMAGTTKTTTTTTAAAVAAQPRPPPQQQQQQETTIKKNKNTKKNNKQNNKKKRRRRRRRDSRKAMITRTERPSTMSWSLEPYLTISLESAALKNKLPSIPFHRLVNRQSFRLCFLHTQLNHIIWTVHYHYNRQTTTIYKVYPHFGDETNPYFKVTSSSNHRPTRVLFMADLTDFGSSQVLWSSWSNGVDPSRLGFFSLQTS